MNTVSLNRLCVGIAAVLFIVAGILTWFGPASLVAFGLAVLAISFFA